MTELEVLELILEKLKERSKIINEEEKKVKETLKNKELFNSFELRYAGQKYENSTMIYWIQNLLLEKLTNKHDRVGYHRKAKNSPSE